MERYNLD